MEGQVGLEPTTPCLRGRCSNQLSYWPMYGRTHKTLANYLCFCKPFDDFEGLNGLWLAYVIYLVLHDCAERCRTADGKYVPENKYYRKDDPDCIAAGFCKVGK